MLPRLRLDVGITLLVHGLELAATCHPPPATRPPPAARHPPPDAAGGGSTSTVDVGPPELTLRTGAAFPSLVARACPTLRASPRTRAWTTGLPFWLTMATPTPPVTSTVAIQFEDVYASF